MPGNCACIDLALSFEKEVLGSADSPARVWINPWGLAEKDLDDLNRGLPHRVGFAVKDNTRAAHFFGSTLSELPDLEEDFRRKLTGMSKVLTN